VQQWQHLYVSLDIMQSSCQGTKPIHKKKHKNLLLNQAKWQPGTRVHRSLDYKSHQRNTCHTVYTVIHSFINHFPFGSVQFVLAYAASSCCCCSSSSKQGCSHHCCLTPWCEAVSSSICSGSSRQQESHLHRW